MHFNPVLHRLTVVLAGCMLVLLIAGALIAGAGSPLGPTAANSAWLRLHSFAAGLAGGVSLVTVVALLRSDARKWLKLIGLMTLAILCGAALLGLVPRGPMTGVAHAVLSHAAFASAVLLTLGTSENWNRKAVPLVDRGWPSLRSLAWLTPFAVLLQIALGAAYRYQAMSAIPHASWAFPATLTILMLAAFTMSAAGSDEHADLRKGSIALMTLVCVQLVLGVAAFLGRMDPPVNFLPAEAMVALRATHLGTGALVFGFTVAQSAQVLRCAAPAADSATAEPSEHWAGNGRRG